MSSPNQVSAGWLGCPPPSVEAEYDGQHPLDRLQRVDWNAADVSQQTGAGYGAHSGWHGNAGPVHASVSGCDGRAHLRSRLLGADRDHDEQIALAAGP